MDTSLQPIANTDVYALFLTADDQDNSKLTLQASRREAERFIKFIRENSLGLVDGLGAFASHLEETGRSAKTVNKVISLIRGRIKRAFELHKDHLDKAKLYDLEKALNKVKRNKLADKEKSVRRDRILTASEVTTLLEGMRSGQLKKLVTSPERVSLIAELMNATGVRVNEALSIQKARMKRPRGASYFEIEIDGKGNKARTVLVSIELISRITEAFGQGNTYLFEHGIGKRYNCCYISDQIAKAGLVILGKHIGAHTFRHSFANRILKSGKSLKAVSRYLGHSTTAITADLYIHDDLGWDDLKKSEYD